MPGAETNTLETAASEAPIWKSCKTMNQKIMVQGGFNPFEKY